MLAFSQLLDRLSYTGSTLDKRRLMAEYFKATVDPERGWALSALAGTLNFPAAKPSLQLKLRERNVKHCSSPAVKSPLPRQYITITMASRLARSAAGKQLESFQSSRDEKRLTSMNYQEPPNFDPPSRSAPSLPSAQL